MVTLLIRGSSRLVHSAAPACALACGGAGSTIFSAGGRGGASRTGRWNAIRLMIAPVSR